MEEYMRGIVVASTGQYYCCGNSSAMLTSSRKVYGWGMSLVICINRY